MIVLVLPICASASASEIGGGMQSALSGCVLLARSGEIADAQLHMVRAERACVALAGARNAAEVESLRAACRAEANKGHFTMRHRASITSLHKTAGRKACDRVFAGIAVK
jgi:hypothetical protein